MSAPAKFWEPVRGGKTRCTLCPHYCVIAEGRDGICKARGTRDGELVSLIYNRPATVVSDEIEKKPLFHFHPGTRALSLGTYGCNVLCAGCPTWQLSHASGREAEKVAELTPKAAVNMAKRHKLQGVAFTYNDPAIWAEYVHDVSAAFRKAGLYTAFITAGYITRDALDYIAPVLDAFKYDLKASGADGWGWLTKVPNPAPTMEAAVRAQEVHGCHVEVVSNIVPGMNDRDADIRAMAATVRDRLGSKTPWHVTRFQPEFELSYLTATPVGTLERAVQIGRKAGLDFVYVGNVPGSPYRQTVCPSCSRTAIRRADRGVEEVWVREGLCPSCGEDLHIRM